MEAIEIKASGHPVTLAVGTVPFNGVITSRHFSIEQRNHLLSKNIIDSQGCVFPGTGLGNSELDDYAVNVLNKYGRYVNPDPTPEKGSYFRSDHFNFAKVGVPALYLGKGFDNLEHGKEWALAEAEKWTMNNYHKPSDNYEPDLWIFDGMIEDIRVYFEIGYDLSITDKFPNWSADSPFKSARDKMMMN